MTIWHISLRTRHSSVYSFLQKEYFISCIIMYYWISIGYYALWHERVDNTKYTHCLKKFYIRNMLFIKPFCDLKLYFVDTIGFWRWCITHRNIGFSDFVHRPDFSKYQWKNTTFRKLDLLVQWLRLAFSKGPNRVGVFPHLRTETDPVSETLCFFIGI
jgi:hypothetical protein